MGRFRQRAGENGSEAIVEGADLAADGEQATPRCAVHQSRNWLLLPGGGPQVGALCT